MDDEFKIELGDNFGTAIWVTSTSEDDHFVVMRSDSVGAAHATIRVKSFEDGVKLAQLMAQVTIVKA